MTPTEPRLQAALVTALTQIRATVASVAVRTADNFGALAQSSGRVAQRDLLESLQAEMRRNLLKFQRVFDDELRARVALELAPQRDAQPPHAAESWQSLTLVDDREVDDRLHCDRLSQQIAHSCEGELRDLTAHMGSLNCTHGDQDGNPLRAEVLGATLYRAIKALSEQPEARKLLMQELGVGVAHAMPDCYAMILRDLKARGVQPAALKVRTVEGPGFQLPGLHSGYATLNTVPGRPGEIDVPSALRTPGLGAHSRTTAPPRLDVGAGITAVDAAARQRGDHADVQLMELLRRLTVLASRPGEPGDAGETGGTRPSTTQPQAPDNVADRANPRSVNLIQAHRGELVRATAGKLDHLVIDAVGSLFEQILSDTRVPPQLARQIARLQLPVLRMALNDASFFTSRRHPVRQFVNRVASLACAFDDFDAGPGKQFLDRVGGLVQEIVDGNFDQVGLYIAKLAALEAFMDDANQEDAQQKEAASTLNHKESELRLQQRHMVQLRAALAPLPLPPYLRDFLAQVWSQALVLAASRDGIESDRAQRYRRVGRDLVMSVQAKGLPGLRKKFLMALPTLMKDLQEGLQLIGWPAAEQCDFFNKLRPVHAESLNAAPASELDRNMLVRQLDTVFNIKVANPESLSPADLAPEVDSAVIARHFTADEARRIGLVDEAAVDWAATVAVHVAVESSPHTEALPSTAAGSDPFGAALSKPAALPASPDAGLIEHLKLGVAYQMHLKDEWQKVRLTHVSAARSFFVFTTGRVHQETISMTARMVARMCETGRMRAVESAYLMERATQRARKQLASMRAPGRP